MTVLSAEIIDEFYSGLEKATSKNFYDDTFLMRYKSNLTALYRFAMPEFIQLFSDRLKSIQKSAFDWTNIGLNLTSDWSVDRQHANFHWYYLAVKLVESEVNTGLGITDFIFPGVTIIPKDLEKLIEDDSLHSKCVGRFSFLIYTDNFSRLIIANRMYLVATAHQVPLASYGVTFDERMALAPFDLLQIRLKLRYPNKFYRPVVIANWDEFRSVYLEDWSSQSLVQDFDDLLYPLYDLVVNFFLEIADLNINTRTVDLVESFYSLYLKPLGPVEANCFYGRQIAKESGGHTVYLLDILLDLLESDNLLTLKPLMTDLALWITQHNPALIFADPYVDSEYKNRKMSKYFDIQPLSKEFQRLIAGRNRDQLRENEFKLIEALCGQLDYLTAQEQGAWINLESCIMADLWDKIKTIFHLRNEYNQSSSYYKPIGGDLVRSSYEYVYHRQGINLQYIRIARCLQACGLLATVGNIDYFQLLMPWITSPIDSVTDIRFSTLPLSHFIISEHEPRYLIYLGNSLNYHQSTQCFYNLNAQKVCPLTTYEYQCVQYYAAKIFRSYPRIPQSANYRIRASTLKELVDLVNNSLHYEGIVNADGYTLRKGCSITWSKPNTCAILEKSLPLKVIEYVFDDQTVSYKIRDSWDPRTVHTHSFCFKQGSKEQRFFEQGRLSTRLAVILHTAVHMGHARPNFTKKKYERSYLAFSRFRDFYLSMPPDEQERLTMISMRYEALTRTFGEVWSNGFPDCMSAASKWFSTLILDYLPQVQFCQEIEQNKQYNQYLANARFYSKQLSAVYIDNDLTSTIPELIQLLSSSSVPISSFEAWLVALGLHGAESNDSHDLKLSHLLSIADKPYSFFADSASDDVTSPSSSKNSSFDNSSPG